jgi:ubiquinone/menaquinone biosynthesis C-methylase UbiE
VMRPDVATRGEVVVLPFPAGRPAREATLASCAALSLEASDHGVPAYLNAYYWWAYVHPAAVRIFERQWLANLILWGNYARLRDAALDELAFGLSGTTLQVACAYGDLTTRLSAQAAAAEGRIDVVDVLPIQLRNLRKKLPADAPVRLLAMDSTELTLPDASYDQALVFFLLHEQPQHCRERTLGEVMRVVRPGGKIVVVDYALPRWWQPLRYLWRPLLAALEPFALDLWRKEIASWLPRPWKLRPARRESFFGGLYQKVVITR